MSGFIQPGFLSDKSADQRAGIRRIFGARTADLLATLSKDMVWLVMIGGVLGVVMSFPAINWWLERFAFRIEPGYQMLLMPVMLTALIAVSVVVSKALQGTKTKAIEAIRYE